jgi:hypothetical protein
VLQWTRQFGTNDTYDEASGVSADGIGNVYVVGSMDNIRTLFNDAFIRKYDADGTLQWTREQLGRAYSVSADGLGNIFVADPLRKFDAAGNLLWTQEVGGAVSVDGLGNVFVANPLRKFDAAGNLLWIQEVGGAVSPDGLGNVYVSGTISAGVGIRDVFLSKYDAEGGLEWTHLLETDQNDYNSGVSADGLGNAYVSGTILVKQLDCCPFDPGESDPFLAKFNDCPDCEPPPIPPIVVDVNFGDILQGSLITHQFTTSFGDQPDTWSNLVSYKTTVNPPTLSETGLFSWKTTKLDAGGLYQFDVTATNAGGSDTGRLTLRLAVIPEPSALLLVSLGICTALVTLLVRRRANVSCRWRCILPALIIVASSNSAAVAEPIRFIHAAEVDPESSAFAGTLGGVPFTTESFVITAFGDTKDRTIAPESSCPPFCNYIQIHHTSAAIAIDGLGTFAILSGTRNVSEIFFDTVDFRLDEPPLHLERVLERLSLDRTWVFENDMGPISRRGGLAGGVALETTGGVLVFNQANNFQITFTATIGVPEPAAVWLAVIGFALLGLRRKRRQHMPFPNVATTRPNGGNES